MCAWSNVHRFGTFDLRVTCRTTWISRIVTRDNLLLKKDPVNPDSWTSLGKIVGNVCSMNAQFSALMHSRGQDWLILALSLTNLIHIVYTTENALVHKCHAIQLTRIAPAFLSISFDVASIKLTMSSSFCFRNEVNMQQVDTISQNNSVSNHAILTFRMRDTCLTR